jgi:hypothetical protein
VDIFEDLHLKNIDINMTEYETKFTKLGNPIYFIKLMK